MHSALFLWLVAVPVCLGANYNPDADLTAPQIIRRHGYSVESHTIVTEDGYLLTLHRITGSPNRPQSPTLSPATTSSIMTPAVTFGTATTPYIAITTNENFTTVPYKTVVANATPTPAPPCTSTTNCQTTPTKLQTSTPATTSTTKSPTTQSTPSSLPTTTTTTTTTNSQQPITTTTNSQQPITTTPYTTTITTQTTSTTTNSPPTTIPYTTPITTQTTITTTTVKPMPISSSPIFIQHGLLGSSADWIISGPGKALAYLLADEGYDVWLGNARGNTYSRAHVTLSTCDAKFWDFSWHEMGYYDLPAAIDYVIKVTGSSSVIYIGHSMGTTMFYAMAASRPEYNNKVGAMFSLAPVAYMRNVKSPIRLLAPFSREVEYIFQLLGANQFLPQNKILQLFAKYGCLLVATEKKICENIIFLLAGFDAAQFNITLLPLVLKHTPAGTSTKTVIHFAQEIQSGRFQQYDHGSRDNWRIYNQSTPPEYNVSLISAPIELHYAKNDWLASTEAVEAFYLQLSGRIGKYLVKLPEFNHLDFLWGIDAKTLVYDQVIARVKQLSPPPTSEDKMKMPYKKVNTFNPYRVKMMDNDRSRESFHKKQLEGMGKFTGIRRVDPVIEKILKGNRFQRRFIRIGK